MWFLTHEGIDRYNGKQYVHYSLSADGQPNMKSFPNLNTLEIDTAGVIWEIGKTDIFLSTIHYKTNTSWPIICQQRQKQQWASTHQYLFGQQNNIWLCTKDKQYIFDIDQEKLIRLTSSIQEEITCITEAGNNQYFLGTNHNIFCVELIDKHQLQIQNIPNWTNSKLLLICIFTKALRLLL